MTGLDLFVHTECIVSCVDSNVSCLQANCIDSTAAPEAVFASEVKKMSAENMKPQEQLTLEPYERDHAVVVGIYRYTNFWLFSLTSSNKYWPPLPWHTLVQPVVFRSWTEIICVCKQETTWQSWWLFSYFSYRIIALLSVKASQLPMTFHCILLQLQKWNEFNTFFLYIHCSSLPQFIFKDVKSLLSYCYPIWRTCWPKVCGKI